MTKNVLFTKFNSCKRSILIFLLTMFVCLGAVAQNRQITGKVSSSDDGNPLPGVSIKVKGTTTGVVTDVNGSFKLTVPANATLVFSYIGYVTQEVVLGSRSVVDVKLVLQLSALNEIVVVGYGTQKRTDLTGSISSVSAQTIAQVPVTSLEQAMQGRAAGVQVTNNDGAPGGNITVLIRGTGSLANGGNVPLYVVDGYPLEVGGINNINPNDIESIDILKDASATAIYGVRAANGVVIVTTKKGKKNSVQISLDGYEAFQSRPKEYDVLNANQFATLANQQAAASNGAFQSFTAWSNPASLTNVNWQNAIYNPGLTQNYGLSVRGGSDKVQSATSIGYYNQKGIVLGSFFQRITLGNNTDYQPTKWLKSSTSVKYSYQNANNPYGTGSLIGVSELPPTLDGGNKLTNQIYDGNGNYGFFNPVYVYVAKYSNPLYGINNNRYQNVTNFFLSNTSLEATLLPGLKLKTNAGVTYNGYAGYYFQPEDDRLVNQYGAAAGATQAAYYSQNINSSFDWLWENTLSYDRTFGKHTINFVTGYTEQDVDYNTMSGSGVPPNNTVQDLFQSSNAVFTQGGNIQQVTTLASEFARLGYNYSEKYFITGTVRRDGSSKFAPGHQSGIFPSGAVSWKAKEEQFFKSLDWLDNLKFRGSYGEVGNLGAIPDFQFNALYAAGASSQTNTSGFDNGYALGPYNGKAYNPGIYSTQPANPNLKWETDYQTDIGVDMAFLHGDLTFTADWFYRKSKDFLLTLPAPAQSGYSFLTQNVGSMDNKGLELALGYAHNVSSTLHFGANLTLTTVYNRLTSLTSGARNIDNFGNPTLGAPAMIGWPIYSQTYIGQPIGEFYGYKSIGIIQSAQQLAALNANAIAHGAPYYYSSGAQPGDRLFADITNQGYVNASSETSLGSPIPKFYGGLNLTASYKAWDVVLYFYGVYGNKIFDYAESSLESFGNRGFVGVENISEQYYQNAWTPTNHSNTYARITPNDNSIQDLFASSAYIQDGSFVKLKTLTIGYTLPADLLRQISVSKVRVYVSSQNLFTVTGYKGLDPEIGQQGSNATQTGIDAGTYPSSRYFTVGLNVTF